MMVILFNWVLIIKEELKVEEKDFLEEWCMLLIHSIEIYRAVKMRIEVNRTYQQTNTFR